MDQNAFLPGLEFPHILRRLSLLVVRSSEWTCSFVFATKVLPAPIYIRGDEVILCLLWHDVSEVSVAVILRELSMSDMRIRLLLGPQLEKRDKGVAFAYCPADLSKRL